jgi:SAM-dependent methyltransferase
MVLDASFLESGCFQMWKSGMGLKKIARAVQEKVARIKVARRRRLNSRKDTGEVFDDIYRRGEWGKGNGEGPYSGPGSRGSAIDEYVKVVSDFVGEHGIASIVDIGCGDFYVGGRLLDRLRPDISYVGLDVSRVIIAHNRREHGRANVRFEWVDATAGPLPDGDLCLVRQVMQHLSNAEIQAMLRQLAKFRYVIVTEHHPAGLLRANADKAHGGDTRVIDGSAVVLDQPPFNVKGLKTLLETDASPSDRARGRLVSVLANCSDQISSGN